MNKVPRKAWEVGAQWEAKTERGELHAVIIGAGSKPGYKTIRMQYVNGPSAKRGPIEQEYPHRHMLRYFTYKE